jgi:hypothetical protein
MHYLHEMHETNIQREHSDNINWISIKLHIISAQFNIIITLREDQNQINF